MSLDIRLYGVEEILRVPVAQLQDDVRFDTDEYDTVSMRIDSGSGELVITQEKTYFDGNITHNLSAMANEAGIYLALWRPEELEFTQAGQLIDLLQAGLDRLGYDKEYFRTLSPANGWGTYEGLVTIVWKYLWACVQYPQATIYVSR
jgi:hypothetical protein